MIGKIGKISGLIMVSFTLSLPMAYGIQDRFPPAGSQFQPPRNVSAGQQYPMQNSPVPSSSMRSGGGSQVNAPQYGGQQGGSVQNFQKFPPVQQVQGALPARQQQYSQQVQAGSQSVQPRGPRETGMNSYSGQQYGSVSGGMGNRSYQQSHQSGFQQGGVDLDALMQKERQDFGVAPKSNLHPGPMHGPTPRSIPGGQLLTTKGLLSLVETKASPYLLFDVLGGPEILPGAINVVMAYQPGSFQDSIQQQFGQYLQQVSRGNKEIPLVFYCQSVQCWMSYNAALRAINLGYRNVLWYRGGIESWKAAGKQVVSAQQPY